MKPVLISACLLGTPCRYDGEARPFQAVIDFAREHECIPVCPERLGGFTAPHPPSEVDSSQPFPHVVGENGEDRTAAFVQGARRTMEVALRQGCALAVLKSKSPSCGSSRIYDGTFTGTLVPGQGVATALLREAGVRVIDEHQLAAALAAPDFDEGDLIDRGILPGEHDRPDDAC